VVGFLGAVGALLLWTVFLVSSCSTTPESLEDPVSAPAAQDSPDTPPPASEDPREALLANMAHYLSVQAPTLYPVRVFFGQVPPGMWGYCTFLEAEQVLEIHISDICNASMCIEVMIHEWAHAVAWFHGGLAPGHGSPWGVAYSEVYLAVLRAQWVRQGLEELEGLEALPVLWCDHE
jgi:hypothetical protein